jgi:formylglycine-generating enzyme required for sulfatase activity
MRLRVLAGLVMTMALVLGPSAPAAPAGSRVALVIGNGAYELAGQLRNPVNDARAIAAALTNLGYSVQLVTDAKKPDMDAALAQFAAAASAADQAVVFFSGHGVEVRGVNYLLPVDTQNVSETTIPLKAVPLPTIMDIADSARQLGLVMVDACRNNPLGSSNAKAVRGLGAVEPAGGKLLVAFATKHGRIAEDGNGPDSPFTTAILQALKVPGLELGLFWRKVHDSVMSATGGSQEPFTYGSLSAEQQYLNPPVSTASASTPSASTPSVSPPRPYDARATELAMWQSAQSIGTVEAYREYLSRYPKGQFSALAKLQIAALNHPARVVSPPPAAAARPQELITPLRPQDEQPPPPPPVRGGASIRDCSECPELVTIPAGHFLIGSPKNERGRMKDEGPQHPVDVAAFALGKYDVTFDEWDACVLARACSKHPSDQGWGRGRRPVINVTWNDAQEYLRWLSRKSGRTYRLPSEAEWEYAARAGTSTAYYWGGSAVQGNANCDGCGGQFTRRTAPVGSFPANPLGLFDMAGNVWQFTQDCWHPSYAGAPSDGHAWGDCTSGRVVRGGSWANTPPKLRSASRTGDANIYGLVGFRVARSL